MARSLQNSFQQSASNAGHVRLYVALLLIGMIASLFSGCQQGPGGMAMRQYQQDSDRLLSEFRAQKKRAEELETRNAQLEQRLAESEKLLALGPTGPQSERELSQPIFQQPLLGGSCRFHSSWHHLVRTGLDPIQLEP